MGVTGKCQFDCVNLKVSYFQNTLMYHLCWHGGVLRRIAEDFYSRLGNGNVVDGHWTTIVCCFLKLIWSFALGMSFGWYWKGRYCFLLDSWLLLCLFDCTCTCILATAWRMIILISLCFHHLAQKGLKKSVIIWIKSFLLVFWW